MVHSRSEQATNPASQLCLLNAGLARNARGVSTLDLFANSW